MPGDERAAWEAPSPSDARRLWDREKALAGAVGTAVVLVLGAVLIWQATGVVVSTVLGSGKEQQAAPARAPLSTPAATAVRTVVPTATRAAVTITIVPTAAPPAATTQAVVPQATGSLAVPPAATTAAQTATMPQATLVPQPTAVPQSAAAPAPTRAATAERIYTVERGDTLFSIARRNGTTVGALVAANGLPSADAVLAVGRRLVIP